MTSLSPKLTALITTIAIAAPVSAAEAANSRHFTPERHFRPASTERHYGNSSRLQSASSTARFHRYGANWR